MIGTLSDTEMDRMLREQEFARLGCHQDGKIYVVPISFAFDSDRLVGQTTEGLKVFMMRANPEVCVELDDVKDLTDWRSVIVFGRFEELAGIEAVQAMGLLIDKYGPVFEDMASPLRRGRDVTPPRIDGEPSPPIVYAIHILEKTGRYETLKG